MERCVQDELGGLTQIPKYLDTTKQLKWILKESVCASQECEGFKFSLKKEVLNFSIMPVSSFAKEPFQVDEFPLHQISLNI